MHLPNVLTLFAMAVASTAAMPTATDQSGVALKGLSNSLKPMPLCIQYRVSVKSKSNTIN